MGSIKERSSIAIKMDSFMVLKNILHFGCSNNIFVDFQCERFPPSTWFEAGFLSPSVVGPRRRQCVHRELYWVVKTPQLLKFWVDRIPKVFSNFIKSDKVNASL